MKKLSVCRFSTMAAVASAFTLTYATSAANIGFVVGVGNGTIDQTFDIGWAARLTSLGHTVTTIVETNAASTPLLGTMDLFIVSSDVASGSVLSGIGINQPKPYITYEYGIWDEIFGGTSPNTTAGAANNITILNSLSPLAAGLSGNVSMYTGTGGGPRVNLSPVAAGTQVIASSVSNSTYAVMLNLEPGQLGGLVSSVQYGPWSSRRIGVPCYADWDPALVTADGWKILDGAVAYALIPEPSSVALIGLGLAALLLRRRAR